VWLLATLRSDGNTISELGKKDISIYSTMKTDRAAGEVRSEMPKRTYHHKFGDNDLLPAGS